MASGIRFSLREDAVTRSSRSTPFQSVGKAEIIKNTKIFLLYWIYGASCCIIEAEKICRLIRCRYHEPETGEEVRAVVTMVKIFVKIVKIMIALFKLGGGAQAWVDAMESRYAGE